MTDLYETLGVERTASSADIKAAYRRAAKTAHPDTPTGSAVKFQAIAIAHRILSDEDKRAKYDQTGSTEEQPDQRLAQAVDLVAQIIEMTLQQPNAIYGDVIGMADKQLGVAIRELEAQAKKAEADIEKTRKLRKRFGAKEGKIDRIGAIFDAKVQHIENAISQIKGNIEVTRMARAILADQTFEPDVRPMPQQQPVYNTSLQNARAGLGNTFFTSGTVGR